MTLSKLQQKWASFSPWSKGVHPRTTFLCQDAEIAEFNRDSFDFLWSVECTEDLFDKQVFFQQAATWLRANGKIALCNWTVGDNTKRKKYETN